MTMIDRLLDEEQMADRLGYSRYWLRDKRRDGTGPPFIRLGNRVVYDPEDVEIWLVSQKTNPEKQD